MNAAVSSIADQAVSETVERVLNRYPQYASHNPPPLARPGHREDGPMARVAAGIERLLS